MKSMKLQMRVQPDPSSKLFWLADTVFSKVAIRVKEMGGIPGMLKKGSWVRDEDRERERWTTQVINTFFFNSPFRCLFHNIHR